MCKYVTQLACNVHDIICTALGNADLGNMHFVIEVKVHDNWFAVGLFVAGLNRVRAINIGLPNT